MGNNQCTLSKPKYEASLEMYSSLTHFSKPEIIKLYTKFCKLADLPDFDTHNNNNFIKINANSFEFENSSEDLAAVGIDLFCDNFFTQQKKKENDDDDEELDDRYEYHNFQQRRRQYLAEKEADVFSSEHDEGHVTKLVEEIAQMQQEAENEKKYGTEDEGNLEDLVEVDEEGQPIAENTNNPLAESQNINPDKLLDPESSQNKPKPKKVLKIKTTKAAELRKRASVVRIMMHNLQMEGKEDLTSEQLKELAIEKLLGKLGKLRKFKLPLRNKNSEDYDNMNTSGDSKKTEGDENDNPEDNKEIEKVELDMEKAVQTLDDDQRYMPGNIFNDNKTKNLKVNPFWRQMLDLFASHKKSGESYITFNDFIHMADVFCMNADFEIKREWFYRMLKNLDLESQSHLVRKDRIVVDRNLEMKKSNENNEDNFKIEVPPVENPAENPILPKIEETSNVKQSSNSPMTINQENDDNQDLTIDENERSKSENSAEVVRKSQVEEFLNQQNPNSPSPVDNNNNNNAKVDDDNKKERSATALEFTKSDQAGKVKSPPPALILEAVLLKYYQPLPSQDQLINNNNTNSTNSPRTPSNSGAEDLDDYEKLSKRSLERYFEAILPTEIGNWGFY